MKLIVAVAKNWGIGNKGSLLFDLPEDMEFFRNTTRNNIVVMGRVTLLSLPGGKPLKNRVNIVMTTDKDYTADGCIIVHSIDELLNEIKNYNSDNVFVIGGSKIYNELYPYCNEAYITKVDAIKEADAYLHNFDEDENWFLSYASELHENNGMKFTFNTYKNKNITN
ncbi:MAG: dihydrofolate reductase [Sedimentibacter sp.]|uniref:dihydrofolate reductase n=1 Tax=Sedimentibacter sp. TaxID=1960295 RepID=UPI002981B3FA|nr:dihydrofolate reductase [Sedimentibacter sp.]MDW5299016.1 dihydrofolate reductase [Sedimentibacter sp.]